MHTENFVVNDRSQRQVVEDIRTVLPNIQTSVLPETLVIESINLGDLP